ncbi:MAG: hypothetical protein EOP36_04850 [Rubrivivax sp.]|nr:MAG: hypothetical protein EOP36_04850 [Rubrivivax sp.]
MPRASRSTVHRHDQTTHLRAWALPQSGFFIDLMKGSAVAQSVVVMLGGGGALGAFSCGVWKALAPLLQASGATLVGVGGTSIGAINAAVLAKQGGDFAASAKALEHLWRQRLATPSAPFTAWLGQGRDQQSWNGLLTGLLLGSKNFYKADYTHWNPVAGLDRLNRPLMDRSPMWRLLEEEVGALPASAPGDPILGVAAVDILSGELRLFDSGRESIGVEHLAASSAIPLFFDPVTIDGRLYWDGDMTRQSALPLLLDRLSATGGLPKEPDDGHETLLITVDHMSEALTRLPSSGLEIAYRALDLLLHGKLDAASRAGHRFSRVIDIRRSPLPHDAVSGQFDYSTERVDELIAQGAQQALQAWHG